MSNLDLERDNQLDDDSINETLKEKEEEQDQYIHEQYDKGVIPDYSKKTQSIFNGNAKGTKLIPKKEDDKDDDDKPTYPINKYSQGIPLAESILVNNIPYFIQIFDGKPNYKKKLNYLILILFLQKEPNIYLKSIVSIHLKRFNILLILQNKKL
jgi:hypothetical protein